VSPPDSPSHLQEHPWHGVMLGWGRCPEGDGVGVLLPARVPSCWQGRGAHPSATAQEGWDCTTQD